MDENHTEAEYETVPIEEVEEAVQKKRYEINYTHTALAFGLLFILVSSLVILAREEDRVASVKEIKEAKAEEVKEKNNPFNNISLEARASFVWDVNAQKALYANNQEAQLPLASLAKLMTVFTAANILPPEDTITVEYDSLNEQGDSGLFVFERWKFNDLMDFTLLVSSNDGADAIATAAGAVQLAKNLDTKADTPEAVFIEEMNNQASLMGLQQTYFVNETGLDPNEELSGAYGSAKDVAKLMEAVLSRHPEVLSATVYSTRNITSIDNLTHTATNTNTSVGNIPGLIASKTGYTDLAGGNLVVAFDAGMNHPIIVTVLGSSKDGRFTDVEELVNTTLEFITQQ